MKDLPKELVLKVTMLKVPSGVVTRSGLKEFVGLLPKRLRIRLGKGK